MTSHPSVGTRTLGRDGLSVSTLGLGCMGMSQAYGDADRDESIATIHRALDLGVTFLDTSDVYGSGHNEELVGEAIAGRRDEVQLATKFSITHDEHGQHIDGRPENVRTCAEASLRRLGVDVIDLYYQHRVDPKVPIEDTVGAMGELVQQGKVRHLGLSEASAASVRRAAAVHPIAALQSEWSLWTRNLEAEVVGVAREHGIGIVPFSPLGRGFLTGAITSPDDFGEDDFRRGHPRFTGEAFEVNLRLVDAVQALAAEKGATPGQLALAWVLSRGEDVVPIPGTKRRSYLEENVGAVAVELTADDLARLDDIAPPGVAAGGRYVNASYAYGDSPERGRMSADRLLVAVFASPVSEVLLRWGAELGFRTVLVEPDTGRVPAGTPDVVVRAFADLDDELAGGNADVVVTDHHRDELGEVLRDALARPARWIGVMGNPRHEGPHIALLTDLGVPAEEIARVHRPIGLDIGSKAPAEIALSTLAGLLADRNGRSGGFAHGG